jgi:hypothetical protein
MLKFHLKAAIYLLGATGGLAAGMLYYLYNDGKKELLQDLHRHPAANAAVKKPNQ